MCGVGKSRKAQVQVLSCLRTQMVCVKKLCAAVHAGGTSAISLKNPTEKLVHMGEMKTLSTRLKD